MYSRININLFHLFIILILWCHCCWLMGSHKESTNNTKGGERRLSSLLLTDFQPKKKEKQWFYDKLLIWQLSTVCVFMSIVSGNWFCCSWRWQTGDQFYAKRWWRSNALQCVWIRWYWRSCTGYVQYRCGTCCFTSAIVYCKRGFAFVAKV